MGASPGFQWLSVGSGIEHAEGGGTPTGELTHGFQIWMRMPVANMEDDPRYGTVEPARFAVTVQMLDVELEPGAEWSYTVPDNMDNAIFYCFRGSAIITANSKEGYRCLVFTGKMTREKILWHGPFV